jgi:hypothetical protein
MRQGGSPDRYPRLCRWRDSPGGGAPRSRSAPPARLPGSGGELLRPNPEAQNRACKLAAESGSPPVGPQPIQHDARGHRVVRQEHGFWRGFCGQVTVGNCWGWPCAGRAGVGLGRGTAEPEDHDLGCWWRVAANVQRGPGRTRVTGQDHSLLGASVPPQSVTCPTSPPITGSAAELGDLLPHLREVIVEKIECTPSAAVLQAHCGPSPAACPAEFRGGIRPAHGDLDVAAGEYFPVGRSGDRDVGRIQREFRPRPVPPPGLPFPRIAGELDGEFIRAGSMPVPPPGTTSIRLPVRRLGHRRGRPERRHRAHRPAARRHLRAGPGRGRLRSR